MKLEPGTFSDLGNVTGLNLAGQSTDLIESWNVSGTCGSGKFDPL